MPKLTHLGKTVHFTLDAVQVSQAQRSDFHLTRAQREGISRAEAKIRNFVESYGSSPRVCPKSR